MINDRLVRQSTVDDTIDRLSIHWSNRVFFENFILARENIYLTRHLNISHSVHDAKGTLYCSHNRPAFCSFHVCQGHHAPAASRVNRSTGHQSPNIRGQFILRQNYSDRLRCNFAWLQLSFHSLKKLLQQHEGGDKDLVVGGRPHISSHYFANVLNGLSDVKESKLTGLVVDSALVWAGETITINLQLMQHKNRFSIYC